MVISSGQIEKEPKLEESGILLFDEQKPQESKSSKPELRLNILNEEGLPKSIKETYNVAINKRRKRDQYDAEPGPKNEFNAEVKKLKKNIDEADKKTSLENRYDVLLASEPRDDIINPGDFTLSKKNKDNFKSKVIYSTSFISCLEFWEEMSHKKINDPLLSLEGQSKAAGPKNPKEKFVSYVNCFNQVLQNRKRIHIVEKEFINKMNS